jgi:hypothetical protein
VCPSLGFNVQYHTQVKRVIAYFCTLKFVMKLGLVAHTGNLSIGLGRKTYQYLEFEASLPYKERLFQNLQRSKHL